MGRILLIENNPADVALVRDRLKDHIGETREVQDHMVVPGCPSLGVEDIALSDIDLVLADLELSTTSNQPPGDKFGRDVVLPCLRSRARWIPVLLVSRYLDNDSLLVAETSPFGFDGLVPKRLLNNNAFCRASWDALVRRASLNRVAALTGRDLFALEAALSGKITLSYGGTARNHIAVVGQDTLENLLKLAGFSGGEVVVEHMEQGYSGSMVMRAVCRRGNREADWLLKVSRDKAKLDLELRHHRQVQLDGVTRRITVPPLWGAPIVWGSAALIAYEFERGSRTLLELVRCDGIGKALKTIRGALAALYEGCVSETVIPATELQHFVGTSGGRPHFPEGSVLAAFSAGSANEGLDRAVKVMVGCHHGDLHSRNILISDAGVAIIDFAHYVAHGPEEGRKGLPLLDLAKLALDLWINRSGPGPAALLSGDVLESPDFEPITDLFLVGDRPTPGERTFFTVALECLMGRYLTYPNLPELVRRRIRRALSEHYRC